MNRVGLAQRKRCDNRVEGRAVVDQHLIGAAHGTERRRQMAAGRVLERLTCLEDRLLADDAIPSHLIDVAIGILYDPMTREKLDGLFAFVRDGDRIDEEPAILLGMRLLSRIARHYTHPNAAGNGFGGELVLSSF